VNQGSIFAATIQTAEPPTPSDQADVRVRIAGIVFHQTAFRKQKNRDKGTPTTSPILQLWSSFK
jgi:hypothetical protein